MSEGAELNNNLLLPENNINEKEEKEIEVKEGNEGQEEQEQIRDRNEKGEKKKNEELKEKKKLIAIIFLSVLIVISIVIFALVFTFFPDAYTGTIECTYKGSNEETTILSSKYEINKDYEFKIIVNDKTYKNENPSVKQEDDFDVKIKIYSDEIEMNNMFTSTHVKKANMTSEKKTKILNMENCFEDCQYLENFMIQGYDTNQITSLSKLFYNCVNLINVNITDMNTKNITDISYMFANTNISEINLCNFDLGKLTKIDGLFANCSSEITVFIDISKSNYDEQKLKNIMNCSEIIFQNC